MKTPPQKTEEKRLLVGIGASAGGLQPISEIIDWLPANYQGVILVVTHRSPHEPNRLSSLLQRHTRLQVEEPIEGEQFSCTHIYVPGADKVLTVSGRKLHLGLDPERLRRLQRIDDLFVSLAETAGRNAVGVILSGLLWDGVEGLRAIKAAGGTCLVQQPADSTFDSLPRHALETVQCDQIGTPFEIASRLVELAAGRCCA